MTLKHSFSAKRSLYFDILFVLIWCVAAYFYEYHKIVFYKPQSVHNWRQADCASLALMYYQDGMHFFKPQAHNLTSLNSTSGNAATSEVPILYYFIALLYKLFGPHEFIFRAIVSLIYFLGLFALYRWVRLLTHSPFYGICASLLFFTSPVLAYYGNNFLSNVPSLSLAIAGWWLYFLYYIKKENKFFFYSFLLFGLASCMKITGGISMYSIIGIELLRRIGILKNIQFNIIPANFKSIIFSVLVFIVPWLWILYAKQYNDIWSNKYFSTGFFPIWPDAGTKINLVWHSIRDRWAEDYFSAGALWFLLFIVLFTIYYWRRTEVLMQCIIVLTFVQCVAYVILEFGVLHAHDYYITDVYILPVILVVNFLWQLKIHQNSVLNNGLTKIVCVCFLYYNVHHCDLQLKERYEGHWNETPAYIEFHKIKPLLRSVGINPLDSVISIPDHSHFTLYLTNQRGWTNFTVNDSTSFYSCIKHGAKFLLWSNDERGSDFNLDFKIPGKKILTFGRLNVYAFDTAFKPSVINEDVISKMYCDMESVDPLGMVLTNLKTVEFKGGNFQTTDFAFSGSHSIKVSNQYQYALIRTIKCNDSEFYNICIKRKGNGGNLVATSDDAQTYYRNAKDIKQLSGGWESLEINVVPPPNLYGKSINFYYYFNGNDSVYLDDYEIKTLRMPKNNDGL